MNVRRASAVLHRLFCSWKPHRPCAIRRWGAPILAAHFLLPLSIAFTALAQQTIQVPADQPTIQAGIDAAANGDTVLVAPGTYYENIDFKGKAITVTSSGGPTTTIIDGGNKDGFATVTFHNGETRGSVISSFTIRGGGNGIAGGNGEGGVYVNGASPTLAGASPTIQGNTITENYCHNIDVQFATPAILNNEISRVLQGTQPTIYCSFGSGIHLGGTPNFFVRGTTVIGNTIENNFTGSALNLWAAQKVLILGNTIRNNTSPDPGSALISANSSGTVLAQNLIYGNTSTCGGAIAPENGGLTASDPGILIANNTIVDNITVGARGGSECTFIGQIYPGPYSYGLSGPGIVVINNIISGSTSYPSVNCGWFGPRTEAYQPTFENNILYNAGGAFFGSYCIDVSTKYNNIVADPQFVSPSTGDYHIKSSSPAIDAGDNSVLQTLLAMTGSALSNDFDGTNRIQDSVGRGCVIDMGAYEYPGAVGICGVLETLTSSANPATVGQSVTFTAHLMASTGVPTGVVQFMDGTNVLSTQPVSGTGSSAYTTTSLAFGIHTITANYQPAGSFSASSASLIQIINGYTTTTTLRCQPNPTGVFNTALFTAAVTSANGTPTGSIAFTDSGASLGTQTLQNGATAFSYTASLAQTHTITATYIPTASFAPSSTTCSEVVTPLATATILAASPSTVLYGAPVTVTASVSVVTQPTTTGTPGGIVTFYDGTTAIGTVSVDSSGHANLTTATLAVGTHTLTATYAGNSVYAASTSNPFSQVIQPLPADFTITLANPSITIRTQHHTTTVVTLTSLNGFADALAISCGNLPQYLTCRPTSGSAVLAANGSTQVSLYLDTDSVLGYAHNSVSPLPGRLQPRIVCALLFAPLALFGCTRGGNRGKLGIRLVVLVLALFPLSLALVGCGEIIIPAEIPPSVAPGTYVIPITATGAVSGISHTAQLTLQVTP